MTDAPTKPTDEALVEAMFNAYWNAMDKQGGNSDVLHIAIRAALAVARPIIERDALKELRALRVERDEYKRKADLWDHEGWHRDAAR
jgi:hypothetical protein